MNELRKFGLIMAVMVPLVFYFLLPLWTPLPQSWITLCVAAVFGLLGMIYPKSLAGVFRLWMAFGEVVGAINRTVILGVFFYLALVPFGWVRRLFSRDPLGLRISRGPEKESSYKKPRLETIEPQTMERPF